MRVPFNPQLHLSATPIEAIHFNPKSRDDIPQILQGLQYLYTAPEIRDAVFAVLIADIGKEVDFNNGRPGMDLWILLVLGCLRVGLNGDYDRLHDLANEHRTVRAMLGHGGWEDEFEYSLQRLKDNVSLLSEDALMEINTLVVKAGHGLLKKKETEPLKGRCDSFAVDMNVEFPTDIGLLQDAMRKVIVLIERECKRHGIFGWRQANFSLSRLKMLCRKAQQSKRSRQPNAEKEIKKTHKRYLKHAQSYLEKAQASCEQLKTTIGPYLEPQAFAKLDGKLDMIADFQVHARRQIDQIQRRVIEDCMIPSEEKVYSIFEPDVEWIKKGKAGVLVELGIKVCILEDQHQFLLHHRVMQKEQDADIAVSMVETTKANFPALTSCSFDKGFHSKPNQKKLAELLDQVVLPKKGKQSVADKTKEHAADFKAARKQHSAVESAINALEHHGLDRCPDRGIDGFRSYVGLAIVASNLQRIGKILTEHRQSELIRHAA